MAPVIIDIVAPDGRVRCSKCRLEVARYRSNGNIAIAAVQTENSLSWNGTDYEDALDNVTWDTLTVNPGIPNPPDCVAIKDYSEGEGNLKTLLDAGIVTSPEHFVHSGFVMIPICKLTEKGLKLVNEGA